MWVLVISKCGCNRRGSGGIKASLCKPRMPWNLCLLTSMLEGPNQNPIHQCCCSPAVGRMHSLSEEESPVVPSLSEAPCKCTIISVLLHPRLWLLTYNVWYEASLSSWCYLIWKMRSSLGGICCSAYQSASCISVPRSWSLELYLSWTASSVSSWERPWRVLSFLVKAAVYPLEFWVD